MDDPEPEIGKIYYDEKYGRRVQIANRIRGFVYATEVGADPDLAWLVYRSDQWHTLKEINDETWQ